MGDGQMIEFPEAAEQLGIPELQLHTLIQQGTIRATLYLGQVGISQSELDRYLRSN